MPVATFGVVLVLRPCLNLSLKKLLSVGTEGDVCSLAELRSAVPRSLGMVARGGGEMLPVAGGKFEGKFAEFGRGIDPVGLICREFVGIANGSVNLVVAVFLELPGSFEAGVPGIVMPVDGNGAVEMPGRVCDAEGKVAPGTVLLGVVGIPFNAGFGVVGTSVEPGAGTAGSVEPGTVGVAPSGSCADKLSGGVSAGKGVVESAEGEGSRAISGCGGAAFLAVCCLCRTLLAYCQVNGVKAKAPTTTAATGAHVAKLEVGLVVFKFGRATTSAEYSSKALAKSKSCSKLS